MSKNIGPAEMRNAVSSKTVLFTAGVAVAAVVAAYALTAPAAAAGSAVTVAPAVTASSTTTVQASLSGLDALLHGRFAGVGSAVSHQGKTAAHQALLMLGNGSGVLSPDGRTLTLNVPAIGNIGAAVQGALAPIGTGMGALTGSNGQVEQAVNGDLIHISPLLNLGNHGATVTADVPIDLDSAVTPVIANPTTAGAVTITPTAGTVTVNLGNLLSNGTGTGTGTLSPAAQAEITADINTAAANLGNNVVSSATASVENTPITVSANESLLSPATGGEKVCTGGTSTGGSSSGSTSTATNTGLLGGLVGGLLGGTLGTVNHVVGGIVGGTVNNLVCTVSKLIPGLLTTLNLNLGGTVNQIVSGNPPTSSGTASVLGKGTPVDMGIVSTGVANTLVRNFGGIADTGSTGGSSSGGSGSGGSSSTCPAGSILAVCLNANANAGGLLGTGGLLGNLGNGGLLGGVLGGNGSSITPGILGSLLNTNGKNLPIGISVGNGSGSGSSGTLATLNGKGILGNGNKGLVNINTPSTSSGSGSGGQAGSGSGGVLGIHITTPVTGGSNGGSGGILNLGLGK